MEEQIRNTLKSVGMNKNEITVYLDLIKNNGSSALEVSKRTGIHRTNTYDSLNKLSNKGFVTKTGFNHKTVFNAVSPTKIMDYLKQKEQEFEIVLPELEDLASKSSKEQNEISLLEGKFALRNCVEELLEKDSLILVYGASKKTVEAFGEGFLKGFHGKRREKSIKMKHIYNHEEKDRINFLNTLPLTEARALNKKYNTNVCTTICKDTVLFFVHGNPLIIIKIVNPDIAETYKKYFEIMWKTSKLPATHKKK